MDKPSKTVKIRSFPGMITNVDPQDQPPGSAQVQKNVASLSIAQLEVRKGMRDVTWEN